MKQFSFRYGSGTVTADLDEKNILGVLRGKPTPPIDDIPSSLAEALEHPIGSAPLAEYVRPGESVCLVILTVLLAVNIKSIKDEKKVTR